MPKKNRIAIYELLFKEGVMVAKKDVHMPKHPELVDKNVPNLHVMKAMQVWRRGWAATSQGLGTPGCCLPVNKHHQPGADKHRSCMLCFFPITALSHFPDFCRFLFDLLFPPRPQVIYLWMHISSSISEAMTPVCVVALCFSQGRNNAVIQTCACELLSVSKFLFPTYPR